jgi:hypothetical protein
MMIAMRIRPLVASLCNVVGIVALCAQASHEHGDRSLMFGMAGIIAVASVLSLLRPMWAALAGRGLLWMVLAMITLVSVGDRPTVALTAAPLAMCAALLVLGRHALDQADGKFRPNHHRGALTLALVLGFADVATLTLWATFALSTCREALPVGIAFLAIAGAIGASLYGLYRLYAWGFLLNLAVNVAVTLLMVFNVFHLGVIGLVFIVPAVAQILIALPVLIAIIRRRPLTVPASLARLGGFVPTVALLVMAGLNIQLWFGRPALVQLVHWIGYR